MHALKLCSRDDAYAPEAPHERTPQLCLTGFSSGGAQSLSSLTAAFSFPQTVAVGWAHFIAQDLMVGRYIFADGLRNGVATRHSLALTLFFGPLGALSHILTRAAAGKSGGDILGAQASQRGSNADD